MSEDDPRLLELLTAIGRNDDAGVVTSSELLAAHLGWSPADVAATLRDVKAAMLVRGIRTGGTPQPHFDEIELTCKVADTSETPRRRSEVHPWDDGPAPVRWVCPTAGGCTDEDLPL